MEDVEVAGCGMPWKGSWQAGAAGTIHEERNAVRLSISEYFIDLKILPREN